MPNHTFSPAEAVAIERPPMASFLQKVEWETNAYWVAKFLAELGEQQHRSDWLIPIRPGAFAGFIGKPDRTDGWRRNFIDTFVQLGAMVYDEENDHFYVTLRFVAMFERALLEEAQKNALVASA